MITYGPVVQYDKFTKKDENALIFKDKTDNKFISYYPTQKSFKFLNPRSTDKFVIIPWNMLNKMTNKEDFKMYHNSTNCEVLIESTKKIKLLDYQKELVNYIKNLTKYLICNYYSRLYIKLNTGLGKSFIGMYLIKMIKQRTMIVVPTERIMQQWKEMLIEYGIPVIDQYDIAKTKPDINTIKIAVYIINTAIDLDQKYVANFGLCILDEAHEYYTKVHKQIFWLTQAVKYVIGLSATPYESQFAENVFHFLGYPIDGDTLITTKKSSFIVDVYVYKYDNSTDLKNHITEQKNADGDIVEYHEFSYMKDLRQLTLDPNRFKIIKHAIDFIFSISSKHRIFIFSELRDHLDELENYINTIYDSTKISDSTKIKVFTPEIIQLKGGIDNETYIKASNEANIIPTTYGYSRRGISIKSATAIIMATPRKKNIKQICGRILRKGSDESIRRIIVDITDTTNYFSNQLTKRKKVYTAEKFNIYHTKFNSDGEQVSEILPINRRLPRSKPVDYTSVVYDE